MDQYTPSGTLNAFSSVLGRGQPTPDQVSNIAGPVQRTCHFWGVQNRWTSTEVAENDIKRQKRLESLGYFVLRFTDGEVLTAIDRVYQNILAGGGGG